MMRGQTPQIFFPRTGTAHDAPPDHLVGWGGGFRLPIPQPLDAYGVLSISASLAHRPEFHFLKVGNPRRIVQVAKRPRGETSWRRNVQRAN